jgi:predicted Zn-dependent protease
LAGLQPPQYRPLWVSVEKGAAASVILYATTRDAEDALAELLKAYPQDPNLKSATVLTLRG